VIVGAVVAVELAVGAGVPAPGVQEASINVIKKKIIVIRFFILGMPRNSLKCELFSRASDKFMSQY